MATQTQTIHDTSGILVLEKPAARETLSIADGGKAVQLAFDASQAQIAIVQGDLVFRFPDGATIIVAEEALNTAPPAIAAEELEIPRPGELQLAAHSGDMGPTGDRPVSFEEVQELLSIMPAAGAAQAAGEEDVPASGGGSSFSTPVLQQLTSLEALGLLSGESSDGSAVPFSPPSSPAGDRGFVFDVEGDATEASAMPSFPEAAHPGAVEGPSGTPSSGSSAYGGSNSAVSNPGEGHPPLQNETAGGTVPSQDDGERPGEVDTGGSNSAEEEDIPQHNASSEEGGSDEDSNNSGSDPGSGGQESSPPMETSSEESDTQEPSGGPGNGNGNEANPGNGGGNTGGDGPGSGNGGQENNPHNSASNEESGTEERSGGPGNGNGNEANHGNGGGNTGGDGPGTGNGGQENNPHNVLSEEEPTLVMLGASEDPITGFNIAAPSEGGDLLDLSEVLSDYSKFSLAFQMLEDGNEFDVAIQVSTKVRGETITETIAVIDGGSLLDGADPVNPDAGFDAQAALADNLVLMTSAG